MARKTKGQLNDQNFALNEFERRAQFFEEDKSTTSEFHDYDQSS